MSLFDANLVEIKLYYTFKEKNNSKVLMVLTDKKAEELLADEKEKNKFAKFAVMNFHY